MNSTHTRRAAAVAALVVVALIPWILWLAFALPGTATAEHWSSAWVGLDTAIAIAATAGAYLLHRRRSSAALALVATATLMLADAWFDTVTSTGPDLPVALAEAGLVEIPLAAAAVAVAIRLGSRPDRPIEHSAPQVTPIAAAAVVAGGVR